MQVIVQARGHRAVTLPAIFLSGLVIALFSLGSRVAPAVAAEPTEFKVGITSPEVTTFPVWMAEAGGFYKKQGLKVQIATIGGGTRGIQVLLSGDIQAMHVGLAPVAQANRQGADLRLIASTSNTIPFTIFSPPAVKTAADVKGGTAGITTFGSESDIAVTLALKQLGLTRKDVNVVQIGGSQPPARPVILDSTLWSIWPPPRCPGSLMPLW